MQRPQYAMPTQTSEPTIFNTECKRNIRKDLDLPRKWSKKFKYPGVSLKEGFLWQTNKTQKPSKETLNLPNPAIGQKSAFHVAFHQTLGFA